LNLSATSFELARSCTADRFEAKFHYAVWFEDGRSLQVCDHLRTEFGLKGSVFLFLAPTVCGFLFVYEISREPLNGFAPNSQGRRACSLARTTLKVKVKGQRSRSPGTKNGIFGPFGGLHAVYVS